MADLVTDIAHGSVELLNSTDLAERILKQVRERVGRNRLTQRTNTTALTALASAHRDTGTMQPSRWRPTAMPKCSFTSRSTAASLA